MSGAQATAVSRGREQGANVRCTSLSRRNATMEAVERRAGPRAMARDRAHMARRHVPARSDPVVRGSVDGRGSGNPTRFSSIVFRAKYDVNRVSC